MDCQTAQMKLQALIDKELDENEIPEVIGHMEGCYSCREEYIGFLKLQKKLDGQTQPEPPVEWFEQLEKSKPRKSFIRLGWILMLGSYLAMAGWGIFKAIQDSSKEELFPMVMIGGMIGGAVLLLVVTLLDRRKESRTDRYKEVQK